MSATVHQAPDVAPVFICATQMPPMGTEGCTCSSVNTPAGPWPEWDINCPIHGEESPSGNV